MRITQNSVALVTGAASGIGRSVALALVKRGARVALMDIDGNALRNVAANAPAYTTHECDVANNDEVLRAFEQILAAHGTLNLLVNSAGISVAGVVDRLPLEQFRRAMDVNFWGAVYCCRAALPHLRSTRAQGGDAAICNVLSDFALVGMPSKSAYASSKHAARAFTESLAAELHGTGITVTAAYPGATATEIVAHGFSVDPSQRDKEARFLSRGMKADFVAARILRAIERRRSRVLIGADARAIDIATRLSPRLTQFALRRLWRRVPFL